MFTYFECCQQSSKTLFFIYYNGTSIPNSLYPPPNQPIASTIYLLKAIAIIMSRRYTVQSSVIKFGTLLKSPVFRVSNTKLLEMAISAILKSIVDTRTF